LRPAPDGWPTWKRPVPYGISEAIGAAGTVVAPLLAGFSVTLIVLTLGLAPSPEAPASADRATGSAAGEPVLLPDIALAILVAATVALLAAVQCAFWARQYQASPDEIEQWRGGLDDLSDPKRMSAWEEARREQFGYDTLQKRWIGRFRWTYHCGILLVLAALIVLLIPGGHIAVGRWVAIAIAAAGVVAEVIWIAATELGVRWGPADPPNPPLHRRVVRIIVPPFVRGAPEDLDPPREK
jgi:hypothetical protein